MSESHLQELIETKFGFINFAPQVQKQFLIEE